MNGLVSVALEVRLSLAGSGLGLRVGGQPLARSGRRALQGPSRLFEQNGPVPGPDLDTMARADSTWIDREFRRELIATFNGCDSAEEAEKKEAGLEPGTGKVQDSNQGQDWER